MPSSKDAAVAEKPLKQLAVKVAHFQSEGRLLQELGERLVARPEVAIVELIKNAHDADSATCVVEADEAASVIRIVDQGTGITETDFIEKWMRIATDAKSRKPLSTKYQRVQTGEKGIGRFAVRFLGKTLKLISVAADEKRGGKLVRLIATFDWADVDKAKNLSEVEIPYELWEVAAGTPTGTTLEISDLRVAPVDLRKRGVRDEVLKIVSPVTGLDRGRFTPIGQSGKKGLNDPGFEVVLPLPIPVEGEEQEEAGPENLAAFVLANAAGRVSIDLDGTNLTIVASVTGWKKGTAKITKRGFKHNIKGGFHADIRYFPRRSGMFQEKGVEGRAAWQWVRKFSGVAIVDHGLRIRPYGYEDDDWLWQDRDSASNRRQWRSSLMAERFGLLDSEASTNPMLALPLKNQVIGAVFVDSEGKGEDGLIPATDREGFFENGAFRTMQDVVRAGLELLAYVDKENQRRLAQEEADRVAAEAQGSFEAAIKRIKASRTLTTADKHRIIGEYDRLSKDFAQAKDYSRRSAFNLDAMSLLGVVAGFMTHEARRIMHLLTRSVSTLKKLSRSNEEIAADVPKLEKAITEFNGYLEYTSAFVGSMNSDVADTAFPVAAQLQDLVDRFSAFADDRGIEVKVVADDDCFSPKMSVAIYTGIVLNLYTNALKAVIAENPKGTKPRIELRAWNERAWHVVEVVDNGVGIPEDIRERIWDPLFTTTSNSFNPLGSGMGLGLSLVKRLTESIHGRIELAEPPAGYSTCFKLRLKQTNED
jgi:signal transduction histidine kinase